MKTRLTNALPPGKPDNSTTGLVFALLITCAIITLVYFSGQFPTTQLIPGGLTLLALVVIVWNIHRLLTLSFSQIAVLGLLFLHTLNVLRYTNTFIESELFDEGRLPLSMMIAGPILVVGWRGLMTGPGLAAIGVPALYLSWAVLSAGFGSNPAHSYFYGGWLMFMCVLIALALGLSRHPSSFWRNWLYGLIVIGTVTSIASLVLIIAGSPSASWHTLVHNEAVGSTFETARYRGLFVHANHMAANSLLAINAAISLVYLDRERMGLWLHGVIACCGTVVLLSGSRAGVLTFVIALGFYGWLLVAPRWKRRTLNTGIPETRKGLVPLLAIILLLGVGLSPAGSIGLQRLSRTDESLGGGGEDRRLVWASYAKGLVSHPLFGTGFMNSATIDDWHTRRQIDSYAAMSGHSAPVEYGLTTGIPGLLLFLWMLWGGARGLIRPGQKGLAISAIVFWCSTAPTYLLYTAGNEPSAPAVWPLWILLLTCRSMNGTPIEGQVEPPWVLRISRQAESEYRAWMAPEQDPPASR
jgi:hypothetical protein